MKLDVLVDGVPESLPESEPDTTASVEQVEPDVYSVLLDGHSYEARVETSDEAMCVVIDGRRFTVEVRDPRRWSPASGGASGEGRLNITSPMPGRIVRLLVAPGDRVEKGQGILVVEAMKMQNEMKSPKAGQVVSIAVGEGETVAPRQTLAVVE